MKIGYSLAAFVFLILSSTFPASAELKSLSANSMLPACKLFVGNDPVPVDMQFRVGVCMGMVIAASEIGEGEKEVCVREGVSYIQGVKVVINWIEKNPQISDLPFSLIALSAMKSAFPCPK
jgi:hypothetical protein